MHPTARQYFGRIPILAVQSTITCRGSQKYSTNQPLLWSSRFRTATPKAATTLLITSLGLILVCRGWSRMVCSFYVTRVSFLEFMKAGVRGITLIYPAGDDGPFRYGGTGGATFDPSFPATSMPFVLFCFAFLYLFFGFLSFYIFIVY